MAAMVVFAIPELTANYRAVFTEEVVAVVVLRPLCEEGDAIGIGRKKKYFRSEGWLSLLSYVKWIKLQMAAFTSQIKIIYSVEQTYFVGKVYLKRINDH